jgi:hypothetical protein
VKSRTSQFHDKNKKDQKMGLTMQKKGEKNNNKDQQKIYEKKRKEKKRGTLILSASQALTGA